MRSYFVGGCAGSMIKSQIQGWLFSLTSYVLPLILESLVFDLFKSLVFLSLIFCLINGEQPLEGCLVIICLMPLMLFSKWVSADVKSLKILGSLLGACNKIILLNASIKLSFSSLSYIDYAYNFSTYYLIVSI